MDRIKTLSVNSMTSSSLSSKEASRTLGADLVVNSHHQVHNHVRPETADASVMAKSSHMGSKKIPQRPMSAQPAYQKSVEEELELTSRAVTSNIVGRGAGVAGLSAAGSRCNTETTGNGNNKGFPRNLKTNNFFLPPSLKWIKSNKTAASNSLATSPVIFATRASPSQNGSPRSATSPAQSVLTMPNDPPSNSTTCDQGGVSEIASLQNGPMSNGTERNAQEPDQPLRAAKECCTKSFKKSIAGVVISLLVASTLVSATQCMKALYHGGLRIDPDESCTICVKVARYNPTKNHQNMPENANDKAFSLPAIQQTGNRTKNEASTPSSGNGASVVSDVEEVFYAPFFTTWFCSMGTIFFLPIYLMCLLLSGAKSSKIRSTFKEGIQGYRSKGFAFGKFCWRSCGFSFLWLLTNFLYIKALNALGCTEVIALFATNISFVYLLSWVVLHEQFVGIRIVAVILSTTGIALLAYADGIATTKTLAGVVLAAASAAGSAVYKVFFKRVFGEVSFCQVAIFFSSIGLCSLLTLWTIFLALHLTGQETIPWRTLPWPTLIAALLLSLVANLLGNFSIAFTYETFIIIGLVIAVPLSSIIDNFLYEATFDGMKLAGIIIICFGFLVVLFPENWPDALHRLARWYSRRNKNEDEGVRIKAPDLRTGHIGSRLRSPSGRVR